jgi:peptidoglycan/LPS O-acetylase OafA/YrhL
MGMKLQVPGARKNTMCNRSSAAIGRSGGRELMSDTTGILNVGRPKTVDSRIAATATADKYRRDVDGLRAIAVVSVLLFHAFPRWLPGGFVGADIFFVISGYVITSMIWRETATGAFGLRDFYSRRIRRTFPSLLITLVACYAIGWFHLTADEFEELGKHIAGAAVFASNLTLWNEAGYFDAAATTKPLLHLWSLGLEAQFYIVWPIVIWVCTRTRYRLSRTILLLGVASLTFCAALTRDYPMAAFYSPMCRFWELVAGGFCAWRQINQSSPDALRTSDLKSLGGLMVVGAALVTLNDQSVFPFPWAILPVVGTCMLIDAGPSAFLNRRFLGRTPLVMVGLISYPLYLYHWPMLVFERVSSIQEPSNLAKALTLASAILLSAVTWAFVERPIRTRGLGTTKTAILIVLLLAIGAQGANTYHRKGLDFRIKHVAATMVGDTHPDRIDAVAHSYAISK